MTAPRVSEKHLEAMTKAVIFDAVDKAFNRSGHRILLGSFPALRDKADELGIELTDAIEWDIEELIEDAIIELNVSWSE